MKPFTLLSDDLSFAFSAENPTGTRGGGSRGGDCTKLSPTVAVKAGETVTLADIKGSGMIQNMWFTGYVGHSFILRIYWEDQEYQELGIGVFSMRDDFETIYGDGVDKAD